MRYGMIDDGVDGSESGATSRTSVAGRAVERRRRSRSLAAMADDQHLSRAAYDRLKAEHDDLTTRGRVEIARKIETARELGDLSENGDYHAAKEEQGKMEGRIRHLEALLENAEIVEAGRRRRRSQPGSRRRASATRATTTSSATSSARSRSATTTSRSSRPARRSARR